MSEPVLSLGGVSGGDAEAREHNNRGALRHIEGDLDGARAEYLIALQRDPDNATTHNNLGYLFAQQSRWQEAIDHYQTALALDPRRAVAAMNLGLAQAATGNLPAGIASLEQAV